MSKNAVELNNVSKRFVDTHGHTVEAVKGISLNIREGEFFSLLGPSGCGKTTTLRMIAGFELPTGGEIHIHGEPMGDTPAFKRRVNTVFQNYALFPHMTIFDNIAFGLEMEKISKAEIQRRVGEALELVQLPDMEKRRPRQLSGGQQQRIALARALVKRPEVLLLDEPLGALDLKLRKAMQLELKHIQHQVGITFIYVTHDQEEALTMSDRIAVMNEGLVLQMGSPAEIYERPTSRFVADFIGETNLLPATIATVQAGHITVNLAGGLELQADHAGAQFNSGQAVTFALRPEKIFVQPQPHQELYSVPGKIEETVYIGTDTRYMVRIADQHLLVARSQNVSLQATPGLKVGDTAYLCWHPATARVVNNAKNR